MSAIHGIVIWYGLGLFGCGLSIHEWARETRNPCGAITRADFALVFLVAAMGPVFLAVTVFRIAGDLTRDSTIKVRWLAWWARSLISTRSNPDAG